jgi:hypothetical protein
VDQFEFPVAPSFGDGVILSVAVFQVERGISRYDTVCNGRSLAPLVKTRALRDDALRDSEFKLTDYRGMLSTLDALAQSICCPPFANSREGWGILSVVGGDRKSFREAADAEGDRQADYDHVHRQS